MLWIKWKGMVEIIKHKEIMDVVPIISCQNPSWLSKLIMDNGLEKLWRKEKPDYSEFTH